MYYLEHRFRQIHHRMHRDFLFHLLCVYLTSKNFPHFHHYINLLLILLVSELSNLRSILLIIMSTQCKPAPHQTTAFFFFLQLEKKQIFSSLPNPNTRTPCHIGHSVGLLSINTVRVIEFPYVQNCPVSPCTTSRTVLPRSPSASAFVSS